MHEDDDREPDTNQREVAQPAEQNLRRMAAGQSMAFRTHFVQQRRRDRKRANEQEPEE